MSAVVEAKCAKILLCASALEETVNSLNKTLQDVNTTQLMGLIPPMLGAVSEVNLSPGRTRASDALRSVCTAHLSRFRIWVSDGRHVRMVKRTATRILLGQCPGQRET